MKVWEIKAKVEEYINVITPYLNDIINNHKA